MSERQPPAENKMGTMPVNRLLLSMAIPMMISMLVQALYNVVDSYFVAQISEDALNAVSLAFPVQNLMIAVAVGTGVGINALLSKSLGERRQRRANAAAMNGLFLAVLSCLVFMAIGLTCSRFFFQVQTSQQAIVDYGTEYMTIVCGLSVGLFVQITFDRVLQATGRTFYTMITQAVGAIINIIMDPILIFGLFGFPRMEVAGAALATVLGQILAACLSIFFNLTRNHDIQFQFRGFRPDGRIIARIYSVGIPSIIMQSIGSVMVFGMNKILISFTTTATAVFGVYFKLQSFIFMPVFGLNNGMVPIVAFNYGARRPDRIMKTIKLSITYAVCIMLVGLLIFQFAPDVMLNLFRAEGDSGDMLTIGVPALRIISLGFVVSGVSVTASGALEALGQGFASFVISMLRYLALIVPAAWLGSRIWGVCGIWAAFPIAECLTAAASAIIFFSCWQRKIKFD